MSEELLIYADIHDAMRGDGFTLKDVHKCRGTIAGDKDTCIDWIQRNCARPVKILQEKFEAGEQGPSTSLAARMMDNLELDEGIDSGYISKPQSEELLPAPVHKTLDNTVKYVDSPHIATAADAAVPPAATTRIPSMEDDFYLPKSREDQLQLTMKKMLKQQTGDTTSERSVSSSRSTAAAGGSSDEWDHVRQGLKQRFGEDYYAGLRGDILDKDNDKTAANPVSVSATTTSSSRVVTAADVHIPTTSTTSATTSHNNRVAGINKSTGTVRRPAPPIPSTPPVGQQVSGDIVSYHANI